MRPIGRSRNVVRMLAAMLMPERCSSGHCGKFCRWSHLISSARGQRNCWPMFKAVSWHPICQVSLSGWRQPLMAREATVHTTAGMARRTPAPLQTRCTFRFDGGCPRHVMRARNQKQPARSLTASGIIPEAVIGNSLQPERFRAKHALGLDPGDTGSHDENASKQKLEAPVLIHRRSGFRCPGD